MTLSNLLGVLLPGTFNFLEQVVGPASGSLKFNKAVQIAKLAAIIASESGLISVGEAHDDLKITNTVQDHFDEVKASGRLERLDKPHHPGQIAPPASPSSLGPDPSNQDQIKQMYDKHAAPPRTTPPPPLEEERGVVFMPPHKDAPLPEQTPNPDAGRVFTTPDPLMRSAPISSTVGPVSIPSPTTNTGPQGPNDSVAANDGQGQVDGAGELGKADPKELQRQPVDQGWKLDEKAAEKLAAEKERLATDQKRDVVGDAMRQNESQK